MKQAAFLFLAIPILFFSCNKTELKTYSNIQGYAQKGPFVIGTNVTISELDENLKPTGKNYYTTIEEENGKFIFPDVEFSSPYVELIATGKYWSDSNEDIYYGDEITLKSIVDLQNEKGCNINVITHLELKRLKYLVVEKKMKFADAKAQADREIFAIFNLDEDTVVSSESLDITSADEYSRKLLAISCIFERAATGARLDELMIDIMNDIESDGIVDESSVNTKLFTAASCLLLYERIYNLGELVVRNNDILPFLSQYIQNSEIDDSDFLFEIPTESASGIPNLLGVENNYYIENVDSILLCPYFTAPPHTYIGITLSKENGEGSFEIAQDDVSLWRGEGSVNYYNLSISVANKLQDTPIKFEGHGTLKILLRISIDIEESFVETFEVTKYVTW